jgi:2-iminobutanoate/2-iminopropanoate deaminase
VGLDPASGTLVDGGVEAQARRAMENLSAVREAAGSSIGQIVKTTIFVTDLGDFAAVNAVYGSFFEADPPARSTVQVAGLPAGAVVEIEAVALA